jgi:hypothetical protein
MSLERDFLHNIQEKIVQNFQNNISYIQTQHPKLHAKLAAYENAVERGLYQERYELLFEDGDFDIYDKVDKLYLYEKRPKAFVETLTESISYSKKENVFVAFAEDSLSQREDTMLEIEKFIFFGVGNATHLQQIDTKIEAKSYLIVENDLELFRLSLMSIDYTLIAKHATIYFSIMDDDKEFTDLVKRFLKQYFYYNNYIKFLQLPSFEKTKVELFHAAVASQSHLNFSYKSILQQYTRPLQRLQEEFSFLNLLSTQLPKLPVMLLAPGPSFGKNIQWLQENQNHFLIVALSATLPLLYQHNIKPDIVTHIDGFKRSKKHFDLIPAKKFLQNTPLLFSARTPESILDMFEKKDIFLFENGTHYKENFGNFTAFCAGSATYLLLIVFKVQELYLLGLDLAVNQETLQTHSEGYAYTQEATHTQEQLSFRNSLIETKGNFQEKIKTTPNFALSINAINEITQGLKNSEQKVYNLNEGAFFEASIPTKTAMLSRIDIIDKEDLNTKLHALFEKNSQNRLTKSEAQKIHSSLNYAYELKKFLLLLQHTNYANKEACKQEILTIYEKIAKKSEEEILALILTNYCHSEYPRIFNLFNSTQETVYSTHCNKLVQKLLEITQEYIKAIDG